MILNTPGTNSGNKISLTGCRRSREIERDARGDPRIKQKKRIPHSDTIGRLAVAQISIAPPQWAQVRELNGTETCAAS